MNKYIHVVLLALMSFVSVQAESVKDEHQTVTVAMREHAGRLKRIPESSQVDSEIKALTNAVVDAAKDLMETKQKEQELKKAAEVEKSNHKVTKGVPESTAAQLAHEEKWHQVAIEEEKLDAAIRALCAKDPATFSTFTRYKTQVAELSMIKKALIVGGAVVIAVIVKKGYDKFFKTKNKKKIKPCCARTRTR